MYPAPRKCTSSSDGFKSRSGFLHRTGLRANLGRWTIRTFKTVSSKPKIVTTSYTSLRSACHYRVSIRSKSLEQEHSQLSHRSCASRSRIPIDMDCGCCRRGSRLIIALHVLPTTRNPTSGMSDQMALSYQRRAEGKSLCWTATTTRRRSSGYGRYSIPS